MSLVPIRRPPPTCRYGYTSDQALQVFEDLRQDDARVLPVPHAFERMDERDVTFTQVLRILRRGRLTQGPDLTNERLWRMKYQGDSAGQEIGVVVDIDQDRMGNMIAVVTVVVH